MSLYSPSCHIITCRMLLQVSPLLLKSQLTVNCSRLTASEEDGHITTDWSPARMISGVYVVCCFLCNNIRVNTSNIRPTLYRVSQNLQQEQSINLIKPRHISRDLEWNKSNFLFRLLCLSFSILLASQLQFLASAFVCDYTSPLFSQTYFFK